MVLWLIQALKRYEQSKVSHQPPETLYVPKSLAFYKQQTAAAADMTSLIFSWGPSESCQLLDQNLAMDKVARSVGSNDPRMKDDQFPPQLKIETDTYRDNMGEAYVCSRERGCADCQEDFDEVSQSV